MMKSHFENLERLLDQSEDFAGTASYFMEHLASQKAFIDMSVRTSISVLPEILGKGSERVFKKTPIAIVGLQTLKIPAYKMVHGFAFVQEHHLAFFFFKSNAKGMLIFNPLRRGKEAHFLRVSAFQPESNIDLFADVFEGLEN